MASVPSASSSFDVVVVGGAVADTIHCAAAVNARVPCMVGTSNPCTMRCTFGGVGRNIAEACSRLKLSTKLISVVGDDVLGRALVAHCASCGIETGDVAVRSGTPTASYTAILDAHGELVVASAVMSIFDDRFSPSLLKETPTAIAALRDARMVVVDGNVPKNTLEATVDVVVTSRARRQGGGSVRYGWIAYDPISTAKVPRCVDVLTELDIMKPNVLELIALGRQLGLCDASCEVMGATLSEVMDKRKDLARVWCARQKKRRNREKNGIPSTTASNVVPSSSTSPSGVMFPSQLLREGDISSFCTVLENIVETTIAGVLCRAPQLVVLCTMGALGSAVGIGPASRLRAVVDVDADGSSVTTLRYFSPPAVNINDIQKVTGAGDSFLSGFLFGLLHHTKEIEAGNSRVRLEHLVQMANAASATALTTKDTISLKLCPDVLLASVSTAAPARVAPSHL